MKTIATVVMVINMLGTPVPDGFKTPLAQEDFPREKIGSQSVRVVGVGEEAVRQCETAALGTANDLGEAGIDAIVGCAYYEGPVTDDGNAYMTVIDVNMFAAYRSVPK